MAANDILKKDKQAAIDCFHLLHNRSIHATGFAVLHKFPYGAKYSYIGQEHTVYLSKHGNVVHTLERF